MLKKRKRKLWLAGTGRGGSWQSGWHGAETVTRCLSSPADGEVKRERRAGVRQEGAAVDG